MISESKAIEIINKYLSSAQEATEYQYYPVTAFQICNNGQLCECLMDFLGDIYVYAGMDENYDENVCGEEIQEAITYLAFCNGKREST